MNRDAIQKKLAQARTALERAKISMCACQGAVQVLEELLRDEEQQTNASPGEGTPSDA